LGRQAKSFGDQDSWRCELYGIDVSISWKG